MTEQDRLSCTDPTPMLWFLRGKAWERNMRLFALSCCPRIWHLLTEVRSHRAIEMPA
jgi:hypothetical protein